MIEYGIALKQRTLFCTHIPYLRRDYHSIFYILFWILIGRLLRFPIAGRGR